MILGVWDEFIHLNGEVDPRIQFGWPARDVDTLLESLHHHCGFYADSVNLCSREFDETDVERLENIYSPSAFNQIDLTYDSVRRYILERVDWTSSPGWPFKKYAPTNAVLFGHDGVRPMEEKIESFFPFVQMRWDELLNGPAISPIYPFIKDEPTKIQKLKEGRPRIISAVSLVDTIIHYHLYGEWLDNMLSLATVLPNMGGWAPCSGGHRLIKNLFDDPIARDLSHFDWSVTATYVWLMVRLIENLCLNPDLRWITRFRNSMRALYRYPVFKINSNLSFQQNCWGIQKSGCLGTLAFNTVWQVATNTSICHSLGKVWRGIAMGDDTLEQNLGISDYDYAKYLSQYGMINKETEHRFVFAGFNFDNYGAVPEYRSKQFFALLYKDKELAESLESYQFNWHFDPRVSALIRKLLVLVDKSRVRSFACVDRWFNE